MSSLIGPLQIAGATLAVGWPLAAGAGLVLWTRARAAERRRRLARVEGRLQGMFHTLANQPPPARLEFVLEALAEHDEITAEAGARPPRRRRRSAPSA